MIPFQTMLEMFGELLKTIDVNLHEFMKKATLKAKVGMSQEHRQAISSAMRRDEEKSYKVNDKGCWIWIGGRSSGYGTLHRDGLHGAHRFFFVKYKGDIPKGMHLDHLCRDRACVNPDHLEIVTPAENIRRGMGSKIDHRMVKRIKELYKNKELKQWQIGKMFNIGQDEISRIINGRRWYTVAHLFQVVLTTNATRRVNVSAETAEEAQGKVTLAEGETVVEVVDGGELLA